MAELPDQRDVPDPRSGVGEDGEWAPVFEGQREPFRPGMDPRREATQFGEGNDAAVKHGAGSPGQLLPVAERYLARLRVAAPTGDQAPDEFALERLAFLLARIHLAEKYLDENGLLEAEGRPRPIVASLSTWDNSVRKLLAELGLTSVSRASLRLDLLRGDLVDLAVVHAGFRATMGTAVDVVRELAESMLPAEIRTGFLEEFWARYVPAAQAAVGRVSSERELSAGELVAEADEPAGVEAVSDG